MANRVVRVTSTVQQGVGPMLCNRLIWYRDATQKKNEVNGNLLFWEGAYLIRLNRVFVSFLPPHAEARVLYETDLRPETADESDMKRKGLAYSNAIHVLDAQLRAWSLDFTTAELLSASPDVIWRDVKQANNANPANWQHLTRLWHDAVHAADELTQVEQEYFGLD